MNFMGRLAVIFYMTLVLYVGVILLLFTLHRIPYTSLTDVLYVIYYDPQSRLAYGCFAVSLLYLNYVFVRAMRVNVQKGKTIAFDNPAGRVSLSLSALEDLVRRTISRVPEVKEARSTIKAVKKGLVVDARLTLNSEVNIPEMTSRLQDIIRRKIQGTIGIEEDINVRIHVTKIIPERAKRDKSSEKKSKGDEPEPQPNIPFQGYRA